MNPPEVDNLLKFYFLRKYDSLADTLQRLASLLFLFRYLSKYCIFLKTVAQMNVLLAIIGFKTITIIGWQERVLQM